jgi:sec-independent protein translocase protein TatC
VTLGRPSWLRVPNRFKRKQVRGDEQGRMTLLEHLAELRHRILVCVVVVFLGSIVVYFLYNHVLTAFLHPYCQILKSDPGSSPGRCTLYVQDPIDQLTIRIKIAFFGGCAIALPVLLWQTWRFITPGLNPNEKRYAVPFTVASVFLFGLGGFVAWETFPLALRFFHAIGGNHLGTIYAPDPYLRLIMLLIVAYGVAFEFPVVLVALQLAGVLTSAKLRKWRRGAIVGVTLFAGVFTPSSDPVSMFAMAIPMYLFYEGAIVTGRLLKR